jgi:tape measure domain-containing protein
MSGFNKQVRAGATAGMATAGKTAGRSYGTAATSAVKGAGISKAMATETQAGAIASAKAIETQTTRMVAARNRAANAAGTLRVAEMKLTELRGKGNASASQLAAAEERVAKAQRGSQVASTAAATAQRTLVTTGTAAQRATQSLGTATEVATASTSRFGRVGASAMSGIKSGAWSVAAAVPAVGNFTSGLRSSDAAASAFTGRMGTFGGKVSTAMGAASSRVGAFGAAVGRGGSAIAGFGRSVGSSVIGPLGQTARMMAPLAGIAGFVGLAKGAWAASTSIDTTSRTLTGLYGSGTQATSMMGKLRTLATNSPIDYQSYFTAAQNLAYMGVKGDEAIQVMTNLGKASIVAGKGSAGLDQANTALLQMVNSGKVYADQLNQISAAGVPIFSGLAAKFGTNIANVRTMVTAGKVGVQDVLSVIKNGTGATYQQTIAAADQVSKSVGSQWTQLKNKMALASGQMFAPLVSFVGTTLLPALNGLFGFVSRNAGWIKPITIGLLAAVGVIAAVTAATWVWAAATTAVAIPMTAIELPLWAIIAGIAALVAVVYLVASNWSTIWNAMKVAFQAVWMAIQATITWVWTAVLQPVFNAIGVAARAIGAAFSWVWTNVLSPVFNAIGFAARILAAIIMTVLVTPVIIAWNLLSSAALWLWNAAIHPVFSWIGGLATWLWVNALAPAFRGIGAVFSWLYNSVIAPVGRFIGSIFTWLWSSVVSVVVNYIKAGIRAWGMVFSWLYNNVIAPVGRLIGSIFSWLWRSVISPTSTMIKTALSAMGAAFSWVYNSVIHPVWTLLGSAIHAVWAGAISPAFNAIKHGVSLVGDAFNSAVGFITRVWDRVRNAVSKPIHWVVDTVYTHGIKAVWDKVAKFVGLGGLPAAPKFASGGEMPFATVGSGFVTNGPRAIVGEGRRAHPEFVVPTDPQYRGRALGLYSALGSQLGMPQMADGGVLGWLGGVAKSIGAGASKVASGVWSGIKDVGSFMSDPVGNAKKALNWVVDKASGPFSGFPVTKIAAGVPKKAITGLVDKVKSWFTSGGGGAVGGPINFKAGAGVAQWTPQVLQALAMLHQPASWLGTVLRRMNQESGGNPNAINNWDSNARAGIPSQGLMQTIPPTFMSYAGPLAGRGIRDPLANIYAGINYAIHRYGSIAGMNRAGGYAQGGILPFNVFDSGGSLPTGLSLAYNGTGATERVSTDRGGDSPTIVMHASYTVPRSPEEHAAATARALAREVRRLGS